MSLLEREVTMRAQEADSRELQVTVDRSAAALGLGGLEYALFLWAVGDCLRQHRGRRDRKQRLPKNRATAGAEGKQRGSLPLLKTPRRTPEGG